nr:MAG TPA: hypothetical protein [Caudoviricetes sp.]
MKRGVKNWLAFIKEVKRGLTRSTITKTANKRPFLKAGLRLKARRKTPLYYARMKCYKVRISVKRKCY